MFKKKPPKTPEQKHQERRDTMIRSITRTERALVEGGHQTADDAITKIQGHIRHWDQTHENLANFDRKLAELNYDEDEIPL